MKEPYRAVVLMAHANDFFAISFRSNVSEKLCNWPLWLLAPDPDKAVGAE